MCINKNYILSWRMKLLQYAIVTEVKLFLLKLQKQTLFVKKVNY